LQLYYSAAINILGFLWQLKAFKLMIFMALFWSGFVYPMQHPVKKGVSLVQHSITTGFSMFDAALLS
jgi:hypothetical protein